MEWISVEDKQPDHKEPIIYARFHQGKWSVGIAYWTVSDKWNPEINSVLCPQGFTHWKPIGDPPKTPKEVL